MKELAEKVAVEQGIRDDIAAIEKRVETAERNVNSKKSARLFHVSELRHLNSFKSKKKLELAELFQQLKSIRKEVAERQNVLIRASRARKTLEILRNREERKFLEENARYERKNMDEIAGNQFFRKRTHR